MNIAMFTNTFTPHVGGVARSVQGLADELRRRGHAILVVAPWFEGSTHNESGVVRIPAVQQFNGTDFSLPVPLPGMMNSALDAFQPDLVHSHHPFLLGDSALRVAAKFELPIVFTHHTRYEQYTHYLPGDSAALKHFVLDLVTGYCNLCNAVIAPSRSIADLLQGYEVKTTIRVIPTGVDPLYFQAPDDAPLLKDLGIPDDAFVLGHVGRLAQEKNLLYLSKCVIDYLIANSKAHFLLVGDGPVKSDMLALFHHHGLGDRVHPLGVLTRTALAGVYRCMDLFVFTSCSETQGLVLAEAMAAGTPVIAVDAPGVRDIVVDFVNGRLLAPNRPEDFISAITWFTGLSGELRQPVRDSARQAAEQVSLSSCTEAMIDLYDSLIGTRPVIGKIAENRRQHARRRIRNELEILSNYGHAIEDTIKWMPLQKRNGEPTYHNKRQNKNVSQPDAQLNRNIAARWLAAVYAPLFRAFMQSWRRKEIGLDILKKALAQDRRILAVFWHGTYPALFPLLEGFDACTLTSESFRGQIIAHLSRHFGFHSLIIPSHHSGELYRELTRELQLYRCLAVAVDGPHGPYHCIRESLIMLAARLHLVIIPLSIAVKPAIVLHRRWDKLRIPLPFSRVILSVGEPFELPDRIPVHEAKSWARQLQLYMEQNDRATATQLTGD